MNLISNCCIGGDYYNSLSKEYNNPFIWVIIKPKDMITLISHFNTINFENIELLESEFSTINRKCFKIKVDNLFEIHYPHYLKNNKIWFNGNICGCFICGYRKIYYRYIY